MPAGIVVLFGDLNVDNICALPEIPPPGRDVYMSRVETHLGGSAGNTAVVLQKMRQPTRMLGAIGADQWGKFILEELACAGTDTRFIVSKTAGGTGHIFIGVTPNGERTMFSYRGANTHIEPLDISAEIFEDVALIHLSGYVFISESQRRTAWRLVEMAEERGIPLSLDSGLDPVVRQPDDLGSILDHLKICITGQEEAAILTGFSDLPRQASALLEHGIELAAIKLGSRGAYLAWPHGELLLPGFQVEVKDTTGAGDAFSAGLLYGRIRGYSPCASGALANALGGLATTVYGAAWIGREEVLPFLQTVQRQQPDHPARCGIQEAVQRLGMER